MKREDLAQTKKCAGGNLRAVTRVVSQAYDSALAASGLTITQFTILVSIENNPLSTINQLAERLQMDATTLTRNLKPLQKQQLVTTLPGEDQRTRFVSLTEAGRQTLATAFPLWEQLQNKIIGRMGQERFETFLNDLREVVTYL
jgi:DNA-binding MarR family transcriptional regulator